jgi:hypothetical protein
VRRRKPVAAPSIAVPLEPASQRLRPDGVHRLPSQSKLARVLRGVGVAGANPRKFQFL